MSKLFGGVIQLIYGDLFCIGLKRDPSYMGTFVRGYYKVH